MQLSSVRLSTRKTPSSERRLCRRGVLSYRLVFAVAVLYAFLCHMPLIGSIIPRVQLFPAAHAATVPSTTTLDVNATQCTLLRDSFVEMFLDSDAGEVVDCRSAVVALVWDHIINRKYGVASFEQIRHNTTDAQLAELVMRAALGTYIDTTDPSRSFARIRADVYEGRVVRVPGDSDVKVGILEVALVAALLAVWQGWWMASA
jgi:hypothetical protein